MWRKLVRNGRGHGGIELCCVAIMLVIVTILALDIGLVVTACNTNDRACRDAARAAAQGSDYGTALRLAQAAVASHKMAGSNIFQQPTLDTAAFNYIDFGGSPPPNTSPYVDVTTSMQVKVAAPIWYAGTQFNPNNGTLTLLKKYTFPIVKTTLYLP